MISKKKINDVIAILCMTLLSVIMFAPILLMFATSLKSMGEISSREGLLHFFIPVKAHFSNFTEALQQGDWNRYFYNTFLVTVVTVIISLVINSMAGFAFARLNFRGRDQLFFIGLVGLMIPPQATIIPVFFILKNFPLAGGNNIFGQGGMGFINTHFALMAPYLAGSFGVFLFRQFFLNFPQALDDAARIDGLSRFGAFLRIHVPLSKPVFASLLVMKATQCWNEYTWPLIVTTTDRMRTLQIALVIFKDEVHTQWNYMMAMTLIIIAPLAILFLLAQKAFVEGIVTSGIKG